METDFTRYLLVYNLLLYITKGAFTRTILSAEMVSAFDRIDRALARPTHDLENVIPCEMN